MIAAVASIVFCYFVNITPHHTRFLCHMFQNLQGFLRPFRSIIQGPSSGQSFYIIQPYWYSRRDIHAWHLLIKRSKQFFYQLYSNYGRKFAQSPSPVETFTIDKFQTFQGLSLFSRNNSRTFSVFWKSRTFQEFKAGTGTPDHIMTAILLLE